MKKALIIIDMQIMPFIWKDYGGKPLFNENELIRNTQLLIKKARESKTPVYYILYTERGESPRAENQPLWQVHPEIMPEEKDTLIVKYFADSFLKTTLEQNLRQNDINNLVFCGMQTEYCIDTTIKSAYSHGFQSELASDAHSTYDSKSLSATQIINHHNNILLQFTAINPTSDICF